MDEENWVREDETLEDLQIGGLRLIQKKKGFRFGMDSVLLADFAEVKDGDTIADFGSGTGILPLLMIGREKGKRYIGIEIQENMAEMAQRTMRMNGLEEKVTIIPGDIGEISRWIAPGSLDAIVCNPPYGLPGKVMKNQTETLSTARHQGEETMARFLRSAFLSLKGKGRMFLVYPAAQMLSIMTEIQKAHMEPKRFRMVYPDAAHGANLVLIEAIKDARPRLHPMPPLIINDENGHLTKELKSIYHMV